MSFKLAIPEQLKIGEVCHVEIHETHSVLDCLKSLSLILITILNKVLEQSNDSLLGRLYFPIRLHIGQNNAFLLLLTLILLANPSDILHVDQIAHLIIV